MQNYSDEQLITTYLTGNELALEVLIKRYLKPIYGFAFGYVKDRAIAEDITQDTFLKAWRNLKKFDQQKNFKPWLFAIAKNTALDFLKKKQSIPFSAFENADGTNTFVEGLTDYSAKPDIITEQANDFALAMKQLSSKYSQVLSLYYNDQLNFREIAKELEQPLNTVKSRHRRGLVYLRQHISR